MNAAELAQFVPNVHFEQIPIKNLVSNQEYQRELSIRHVNKTAQEFDLYQINPVKVSRRDGVNYVFDGQHTIEIVAKVSGSRETPVWCMIYDDLSYQTEADIFANQKKGTKNLLPYEIFKANVEAGNSLQLNIKACVESYGLKLCSTTADMCICAVSALEFIYNKFGFQTLDETLMICAGTWEGEKLSLSANFLKGIAKLISAYGDELIPEVFIERLGVVSVKEIIRSARERHNGSLGYAETMLQFYNRKTKTGLRRSKLYKHDDELENEESDEEEQNSDSDRDDGFESDEDEQIEMEIL